MRSRRRTFLTAATAAMWGCRKDARQSQPAPQVGWRPIGAWSGRGDSQTDSFNIESGGWRIKWETKNETSPEAGEFRLTVQSAVSGRLIKEAVDHRGAGRDIAYLNDDPRLYDLVIQSHDLDWSVTVEEAVVYYSR